MKNQIRALFVGLTLSLASTSATHAMSQLVSLSCEPLWPVSTTPGNLVYELTTVGRGGAGLLEVTLTADNMPPGVTVSFSPEVLRFTGNQLTAKTARMTVYCPSPMAIDCCPFAITGTAQRESITITNQVMFTTQFVASRAPTLYLDNMGNSNLKLRGLGATAKLYQIEACTDLQNPEWMPLGKTTADGNGRFIFYTAQMPGNSTRFYRAVETGQ